MEIVWVGLPHVTHGLRDYATKKLLSLKHAEFITRIVVEFIAHGRQKGIICQLRSTTSIGHFVAKSNIHVNYDCYSAFESALNKYSRQVIEAKRAKRELQFAASEPHPQPALEAIVKVGPPAFTIVWAPDLLTEADYADLVTAVGDLVREAGGLGLQRIRTGGAGIQVFVGATL